MKKYLVVMALFVAVFGVLLLPALADAKVDVGFNEVENEIDLGTRDVRATAATIINAAMGLLGIIAVIIILLGGFKWMVAAGNDEKVKEAKKLIISGIIGLVIILAAYAIARFVVDALVNATA